MRNLCGLNLSVCHFDFTVPSLNISQRRILHVFYQAELETGRSEIKWKEEQEVLCGSGFGGELQRMLSDKTY